MAGLDLEWDKYNFYIIAGPQTLMLSREEAEGLFIVLGNGLVDQDKIKEDTDDNTKLD